MGDTLLHDIGFISNKIPISGRKVEVLQYFDINTIHINIAYCHYIEPLYICDKTNLF